MFNEAGKGWCSLAYWQSGEWQVIMERLHATEYNPPRAMLFAALRAVHPDACRVVILGQDPYPDRDCCTGIAFSIPPSLRRYPPTLVNLLREYQADLGYPAPKNGDLTKWCEQGVLLWNVYPTCVIGRPGSQHWEEWEYLTKEIVEKLDGQVVFAFLGSAAYKFHEYVHVSKFIKTSHPSPRGVKLGFDGSKLFSTINKHLIEMGKEPVDWELDHGQPQHTNNQPTRGQKEPVLSQHNSERVSEMA